MNTEKLKEALAQCQEALKGLTPMERGAVMFALQLQDGKPGRKRGVKQQLELGANDAR